MVLPKPVNLVAVECISGIKEFKLTLIQTWHQKVYPGTQKIESTKAGRFRFYNVSDNKC